MLFDSSLWRRRPFLHRGFYVFWQFFGGLPEIWGFFWDPKDGSHYCVGVIELVLVMAFLVSKERSAEKFERELANLYCTYVKFDRIRSCDAGFTSLWWILLQKRSKKLEQHERHNTTTNCITYWFYILVAYSYNVCMLQEVFSRRVKKHALVNLVMFEQDWTGMKRQRGWQDRVIGTARRQGEFAFEQYGYGLVRG